jgi:predicted kinase
MTSEVPRLLLMCGLPGSGKTTLATQLAAGLPAVRLCPDEWLADLGVDLFDEDTRDRLERRFWLLAQDILRQGGHVILENGFWLRSDRDEKRLGARALHAAVELHYLDVPLDELCRRVADRSGRNTVPLTRAHLREYSTMFQPPDADELALFDQSDTAPGMTK